MLVLMSHRACDTVHGDCIVVGAMLLLHTCMYASALRHRAGACLIARDSV